MIKIVFLFKIQTFNSTDTVLKNVDVWPSIKLVTFFESKLTFQIQHSIFRTKVRLSICMFLDLGQSHSRYKRLRFVVLYKFFFVPPTKSDNSTATFFLGDYIT